MENNKKKVIRVESGSVKKPSDPNKKVVRRVVKVIDEKDLKNIDINQELKYQNEEIKRKKLEEQRKILLKQQQIKEAEELRRKQEILKKKEELRKKQEELKRKQEEERRKKAEEEKRKKEEEEKLRLILEAKRREEQRIREAERKKEELRKQAEKTAKREAAKKKREKRKAIKARIKEENKKERAAQKNSLKQESFGRKILRILKIIFVSGIITSACGMLVLFLILFSWCKDIPEIDIAELGQSAQTSFIYDSDGEIITTYSGVENREWVKLEDMPDTLVNAFVSIEDKRFYNHGAIDAKRFIKAVLGQITGNDNAGGSTITQQLVKNVYLSNEVTYKRKIQEIVLAYKLEKQMSKEDILESYLNIIYFGSSNYGVAAAARDYFGKELNELSIREIAMLAGLPKNPNGYNPRKNTYIKNDMTKTNKRTDDVLWVMHNENVISDFEYESALKENVPIKEGSSFFSMYDNAHAVEYTMKQVVSDMLEQRGLEDNYENRIAIDNEIRRGGYSIYTTIDSGIQESVQKTIQEWDKYPKVLDSKGKPIINEDGSYEKPQAASVVIDPSNGHILAMVGSRDTPTSMKTLNRAVNSSMPVASTIKPLSIYGPCLEAGLYPGSVECNFKTYIEGYDDKAAYPGGESPEATVTMREALQFSYNVSAVRFLVNNVGYNMSEDYLIALGINKDSIQQTGSGLALGTSGINMLEMTAAYQAFANGGWYYEPKGYTTVVDTKGNVVLDSSAHQEKRQIFSEQSAWLMTDMLTSVVEDGNAGNAKIKGVQVAAKTGTHEQKCAVFAGYTGEYVSCLWIGSDAFSDLSDASGGKQAAPIWQEYMQDIYNKKGINKENVYEEIPDEIQKMTLCADSGLLATDDCSKTFEDYARTDTYECNMHTTALFCNYSGMLVGEDCNMDSVSEKKAMIIPSDSSMATLPDEILKKEWPNAVLVSPENICSAHVNGRTIPTETQIGYAKNLITRIDGLLPNTALEQQYINLLNSDKASLNNMIARAENALYNGAEEPDTFYIEYFDEYNRVKTDINNIQGILNNIAAQAPPATTE